MKKRTSVLFISIIGSVIAYVLFHSRQTGLCNFYCGDLINKIQDAFLFFYIVLLFSVITLKVSDQVFLAWFKYIKFAIPTVFLCALFINLGILHSSPGTWQEMLDWPAVFLLYVLFTLGSILQIIRGYYQK
jgi:hypothetical protein